MSYPPGVTQWHIDYYAGGYDEPREEEDGPPMTTPELIRAIGEALFGPRWQTDLAEHLEVNRRTVQRWLTGQDEPRAGVWKDLEELLSERASSAMRLCDALRAKRSGQP